MQEPPRLLKNRVQAVWLVTSWLTTIIGYYAGVDWLWTAGMASLLTQLLYNTYKTIEGVVWLIRNG